jgi:glutathione S-transferase
LQRFIQVDSEIKSEVEGFLMKKTTLTISSKNYSSWSLRGWLMLKMSGISFEEVKVSATSASARAELLLLSPSMLVPCLHHNGVDVWDTLAIGEYLNEVAPKAGLLPVNTAQRAHCRAICGEMHSGFAALRASLPMNIKASFKGFKVWGKAQNDIDRIVDIWNDCFKRYKGPYLMGPTATLADAMFAPVCLRFASYDVKLSAACSTYVNLILSQTAMVQWIKEAKAEPEDIVELEVEF